MNDRTNSFHAKDRKTWRKWLEKNHIKEENILLILYRQNSKIQCVKYGDAVEEALCFGWIDSKASRRDSESSYRYFSKRKPKGVWSKLNKERIKKLSKLNQIAPAGKASIEMAKKTGAWNALDEVEKLVIPADLQRAFAKNKIASKNFNLFPPGSRKIILGWISYAKQEATRKKRIKETVTLAAKNIRANDYRNKK